MNAAPPPLRLLYVHPLSLPGVEANIVQAAATCRALAARGHEVFLIVPKVKAEHPGAALARLGVLPHERLHLVEEPAIRLKNSSGLASLGVRAALLFFLRGLVRRRRTVIYFRTLKDSRLARFLLRAGALLRVPVVYEAHKLYLEKREEQGFHTGSLERIGRLERLVLRRAGGVVASHPLLAARVRELRALPRALVTIPNAVEFEGAAASAEPAPGFDAVYLGSLFAWKGVDTCLEAAACLAGGAAGARLAILGGNPPERLDELAERVAALGLGDRVSLLGQRPRPEALAILRAARVALVPLSGAHGEGERYTLPLKLLEALGQGVPVVAADTPALCAFVRHGESAWLYPPGDAAAMAAGIRSILGDRELARRLAAGGREVAARHTLAERARRVEEFCRALLPEPHDAG